ncbi:hypothetical protein BC833DRAFT_609453 [Globomyces pollinis-pini]|nr:hypothetical protein BC833DRAFT_609453 [Globomyces pollinis-pini]
MIMVICSLLGSFMGLMGSIWILRNNKLPNNVYRKLMKYMCIGWIIAAGYQFIYEILSFAFVNEDCRLSLLKLNCPMTVRIGYGISTALECFPLMIVCVLMGIPWYLVGHNGSIEQIDFQIVISLASCYSLLQLVILIDNPTVQAIILLANGLFIFGILPGSIYCCFRTWYRLRLERQELGIEIDENGKYKGSFLIARYSYILLVSILISYLPTPAYMSIRPYLHPEDLNFENYMNDAIWLQIFLYCDVFLGTSIGGWFALGIHYLFQKMKFPIHTSSRSETLQDPNSNPSMVIEEICQMDSDGFDKLNQLAIQPSQSMSVGDYEMDFDMDMSLSRDFGQIDSGNSLGLGQRLSENDTNFGQISSYNDMAQSYGFGQGGDSNVKVHTTQDLGPMAPNNSLASDQNVSSNQVYNNMTDSTEPLTNGMFADKTS